MVVYSFLLILLLCFCGTSKAPPIETPTQTCLVQSDFFKGIPTACDAGILQKISDLTIQAAPTGASYGAVNLADLILARSGIFENPDPNLHICSKHLGELGTNWVNNKVINRPQMKKRNGDRVPRCNIPTLAEDPYHHDNTVGGPKNLQKDQSKAIWQKLETFVPLGTGKSIAFGHVEAKSIMHALHFSHVHQSYEIYATAGNR